MDIQTIFYALGSIFMVLGIALLIAIGVIAWKTYSSVQKTVKTTQAKIDDFTQNIPEKIIEYVSARPTLVAGSVGMGLSSLLMRKLKNLIKGN
jgi:hypothetical protein